MVTSAPGATATSSTETARLLLRGDVTVKGRMPWSSNATFLVEVAHAGEEPAVARFRITRGQATALVKRVHALMQSGRPICPMCHQPKDPDGHVCPRGNGHVVHRPA